jgi:hypothetical protein
MCIADLNVSTLPCQHRWYHLIRSCSPSSNLHTCPGRLAIEGWEIKCDFCPYCAGWDVADNGSYKMIGTDRSPSVGGISRSNSVSTAMGVGSVNGGLSMFGTPYVPLSAARRESRAAAGSRRSSLARTDSSGSVSLMAREYSEKNRATNARIDAYVASRPNQFLASSSVTPVVPEIATTTATTPTTSMVASAAAADEEPPSPTDSGSSDDRTEKGSIKGWRKHAKRFSKGIFK